MINIDDRLIKEVSPKIRPNALSVLLAIAIHLNQKTNRCFPSHERLMMLTGVGRDAVYAALEALKTNGLLRSEQGFDAKTGKFTRRTFRVTTRFIKIFVDATDAEPLPDFPDTVQPDTVQPDTENPETKQINNSEQINQKEQIKEVEEEIAAAEILNFPLNENHLPQTNGAATPSTIIEVHDPETPGATIHDAVPSVSPPEFGRVNVEAEVNRLRTDAMAKETFALVRKIPAAKYDDYLTAFSSEVSTTGETYWKTSDFRRHFLNWSEKRYTIEKDRQPATQRSSISGLRRL